MFGFVQLRLDTFLGTIKSWALPIQKMTGETMEKENGCDDDNNITQNTFVMDDNEGSTLSSITNAAPKTPDKVNELLQPSEMGLPPTPPTRRLIMPDESLIDDGYDTDNQVGPFVQGGVEDEALVCMDEEAPDVPETILVVAGEGENSENLIPATVVPGITDDDINDMKVAELRVELERRGMSKNGLKAVLI